MLLALNDLHADMEYVMVDSTIMRVHQDGSNPKGGQGAVMQWESLKEV